MRKIFLYITALILLTSCKDYLDIEPKGKRIPTTIEDYELLLNQVRKHESLKDEIFLTSDDFSYQEINLGEATNPDNQQLQYYTFSDKRNSNLDIPCQTWNDFYNYIYIFNKVITEIDKADTTISHGEEKRLLVKGNAHFNRAIQYFFLVNVFAKHYSDSSASSPGVPLVLKSDVSKNLDGNNTIQEVYDLIEKDLKIAINFLDDQKDDLKSGKGAAYAMLSRIYLYKSNYKLALENAKIAIGYNQLADYTKAVNSENGNNMHVSERYADIYSNTPRYGNNVSTSMQALYEIGDKRPEFFITKAYNGTIFNWYTRMNSLPTVGEMFITIAECEARLSNKGEAISKLNELRKNRISFSQDKIESDFTNDTELLKFILDERRRELFTSVIRLFEIKRLNLEDEFKTTLSHKVGDDVYLAEPNSGKLVIPIPANVKQFNKGL